MALDLLIPLENWLGFAKDTCSITAVVKYYFYIGLVLYHRE
jgi:hypothetical protein